MKRKAAPAFVGARGIDSEPWSHKGDLDHAKALKASGVDFAVLYLGSVTSAMVDNILAGGLAFIPVTYAAHVFNDQAGTMTVAQMKALGMPAGVTVFIDVEGMHAYNMRPVELISRINAWADTVAAAGFVPGIYIGSPQPLTSEELYGLRVVRYWRAPARVVDRNGKLAEPSCGWCMYQLWPSRDWAGVWVDVDFIGRDFKGRVPSWCVSA